MRHIINSKKNGVDTKAKKKAEPVSPAAPRKTRGESMITSLNQILSGDFKVIRRADLDRKFDQLDSE